MSLFKFIKVLLDSLIGLIVVTILFLASEMVLWTIGITPTVTDRKQSAETQWAINFGENNPSTHPKCHRSFPFGKQVVFMGGSSVYGWPDPRSGIVAKFTEKAPEGFTIRNLGIPGKDSFFVERCYSRVAHKSDKLLVVIYSGHNDVINLGLKSPSRMIFLKENPSFLRASIFLQENSRITALLTHLIELFAPQGRLVIDEASHLKNRNIIRRAFRSNLEKIVQSSLSHGDTLILSTTIGNLVDNIHYNPCKAENARGCELYNRAKDLWAREKKREGLKLFAQARDLNIYAQSAFTEMNQDIRDLAKKYRHVHLVDIEKKAYEYFLEEGIGCNLFTQASGTCDQMHPNARASEFIANQIFQTIQSL